MITAPLLRHPPDFSYIRNRHSKKYQYSISPLPTVLRFRCLRCCEIIKTEFVGHATCRELYDAKWCNLTMLISEIELTLDTYIVIPTSTGAPEEIREGLCSDISCARRPRGKQRLAFRGGFRGRRPPPPRKKKKRKKRKKKRKKEKKEKKKKKKKEGNYE